jgi:predicted MFS family arabinose efflux permease
MLVFALTAFAVAGGIHYQTPMLAAIGAELEASTAQMGWVPTLSFGGMFVGVICLVPLGDRVDRRPLVLANYSVLCASQAVMAIAPNIGVLAIASFITGVSSSLIQVLVSIVAERAQPNERGRAVGTLMMALFIGLLFARIAGGMIATHLGWRATYVISTMLLLAVLPLLVARLPHTHPTTAVRYPALMLSLLKLFRENGHIRRVAAVQFLLGICYGGFWAVIAPVLASLHRLGPRDAGLIGIPGAAGILVARPAGRWTDRKGSITVVTTSIVTMVAAWVVLGFGAWALAAIILGVILLDCALRAAMVANQTLANSVAPHARARANTIFGTHVWAGNSTGAFVASNAFAHWGWLAVCTVALCASLAALTVHLILTRGLAAGAVDQTRF